MPFTKEFLTAGTNGAPIPVTGTTSSAATTIHTAGTSTSTKDELWVYAYNPGTAAANLTLQKGGTGANFQNTVSIPNQSGAYAVYTGWPLAAGLSVTAFSTSAVKPILDGFINRIVP